VHVEWPSAIAEPYDARPLARSSLLEHDHIRYEARTSGPEIFHLPSRFSNKMPLSPRMMAQLRSLIPPLNGVLHKGQSGRVGVLGGALDYTGAPYFASISSQRLVSLLTILVLTLAYRAPKGAELAHVICSPTAGGAIKSYSPDLIVHPILGESESTDSVKSQLESILSRLHVLILGPGLGREGYMQKFAKIALEVAKCTLYHSLHLNF
jgi:ATP-dependent NAD(P)H-hydrate dehydratase